MINSVVLEGYLFRDLSELEVSKTSSGKELLSFAFILANNSPNDDTKTFVNCIGCDKLVKYLLNYGTKGTRIFVKGSIIPKKDKTGKQTSLSILLDSVSLIQKEKPSDIDKHNNKKNDIEFNEDDFPF